MHRCAREQTNAQTHKQIHTHKQTHKNKQTHKQIKTNRHTHKQIDAHTYIHTYHYHAIYPVHIDTQVHT